MTRASILRRGSAASRAVAYLTTFCGPDREIPSDELARAAGIDSRSLRAFMGPAMRHRLIVRVKRDRKTYWRLIAAPAAPAAPAAKSQPDPVEIDDDPPIRRVVLAALCEPLAGVSRQTWFPAVQPGAAESGAA